MYLRPCHSKCDVLDGSLVRITHEISLRVAVLELVPQICNCSDERTVLKKNVSVYSIGDT